MEREQEAAWRSFLVLTPLAVAALGLGGYALGLGIDSLGLAHQFANAKTASEIVSPVIREAPLLMAFGGLKLLLEHSREFGAVILTGWATTLSALLAEIAILTKHSTDETTLPPAK